MDGGWGRRRRFGDEMRLGLQEKRLRLSFCHITTFLPTSTDPCFLSNRRHCVRHFHKFSCAQRCIILRLQVCFEVKRQHQKEGEASVSDRTERCFRYSFVGMKLCGVQTGFLHRKSNCLRDIFLHFVVPIISNSLPNYYIW